MTIQKILKRLSDIEAMLSQFLLVGEIVDLDTNQGCVKVDVDGTTSDWLRWTEQRADGGARTWDPLLKGAQVFLACPDGDLNRGVVLGSLNKNDFPAPSDKPNVFMRRFGDGCEIHHDTAQKTLTINSFDSQGTLVLEAKNIHIRTGEGGVYLVDNNGYATALKHISGNQYERESWRDGATVQSKPDHGFNDGAVMR